MVPDFGAWLLAVPEAERSGRVFRLVNAAGVPFHPNRITRIVERIGKAAGVKVGTRTKRNKKTGKATTVSVFAGCHSYRRGFGSKWARRVSSSVLKRLMRHASIATTEGYYVNLDASDVADELWTKYGEQAADSKPVYNNPTTNPPLEV